MAKIDKSESQRRTVAELKLLLRCEVWTPGDTNGLAFTFKRADPNTIPAELVSKVLERLDAAKDTASSLRETRAAIIEIEMYQDRSRRQQGTARAGSGGTM